MSVTKIILFDRGHHVCGWILKRGKSYFASDDFGRELGKFSSIQKALEAFGEIEKVEPK